MTDEPLSWRDGATFRGIPAPAKKQRQPLVKAGAGPGPGPGAGAGAGAGGQLLNEVWSISALIDKMHASVDLDQFRVTVRMLDKVETQILIAGISVAENPLKLWAIHLVLDRRGVAPALRWPANNETPQNEFVTFAADLYWFVKRNQDHRPIFKGWAGAFKHLPAGPAWHASVHRQYVFTAQRYSLAYQCAKGLALNEKQRIELMMLPTNTMQAERRQLQPERFGKLRE